jgi:adenosylcobyric acid synthase
MESEVGSAAGLGLIPASTTLTPEKRTRAVRATTTGGATFGGYEIHLGVTTIATAVPVFPFATLEDGTNDGFQRDDVIGTYLHGAFESADVCTEVFGVPMRVLADKATHYQQLGLWFEQHGRHLDRLGFD